MRNAFAIYHTWPELRNAEYEVLQRILGAARNIGKNAIVINNAGKVIWANPSLAIRTMSNLNPHDVEFAISLHFESPRTCDVYTYYALWQPIEFYRDFGYQKSIDKFSTHHDVLSCHSDIADDHALNIFSGLGRAPITPLESLFHTLPEPFLAPTISKKAKLFYIGINWERIGRPKGRYHDLLETLDKKELIEIYGPEEMHGVAPWAGFQTYQGELPFDGHSMRAAINASGVCLALSSAAHKSTGIMSNRLFEGLASGAAVIATPHPLIDKYFRDVVYVVDDSHGDAMLGQQIQSTLREIRAAPDAASERVLEGQKILRQACSLERSLTSLFENTARRKQHFAEIALSKTAVTAILVMAEGTPTELRDSIEQFVRQASCVVDLHIIASEHLFKEVSRDTFGSLRKLSLHPFPFENGATTFDGIKMPPVRTGPLILQILESVSTPFFAFFTQADRLFHDHFASLAKAVESCPDAAFGGSGTLVRSQDAGGKETIALDSARFQELNDLLLVTGADQRGRFLFRSNLIKPEFAPLLRLMDGEEYRIFALGALLHGPLAQSNYSTHLLDETASLSIRSPVESPELQHQYVRDHFVRDGRRLDRLASSGPMPTVLHAFAPGSDIRWSTHRSPDLATKLMPLDKIIDIRAGAKGVDYLISGFSHPETEAVWLAADRGIIEFTIPQMAAAEDYEIVLNLAGRRATETGRLQHCTILLNKIAIAYIALPEVYTDIRIKMPLNIARTTRVFRVELVPDHAEVVVDQTGRVVDHRTLSLLIRSIAVVRELSQRLPALEVGNIYPCIEGGEATRAFVKGFYAPEHNLTWMCGTDGEICFRATSTPEKPVVILKVAGREAKDGTAQSLKITLNGSACGDFDLGTETKLIRLPCKPEDINGTDIQVDLKAKHADPVYDMGGALVDSRLLGVSLLEIGILDAAHGNALLSERRRKPFSLKRLLRKFSGGGSK
jgi:hypothetical protein